VAVVVIVLLVILVVAEWVLGGCSG
jgi:hypothetical protein